MRALRFLCSTEAPSQQLFLAGFRPNYAEKPVTNKRAPVPFPRQQSPRDKSIIGISKHTLAGSLRSTNAAGASGGLEGLKVLAEFWSDVTELRSHQAGLDLTLWDFLENEHVPTTTAKTLHYMDDARIASGRPAPSKGAFCLDPADLVGIRFHRLHQRSLD